MDKEDLNIINYFKDKKNGFYIDVGCFHPLDRNNTYLLYKKNWRGINIDVSKFSIDLFKLAYCFTNFGWKKWNHLSKISELNSTPHFPTVSRHDSAL